MLLLSGEYVREEVVMTDGAALSLISCSVSLGGHGNSYLMGSWGDRGLLLCTASPTDEGRPTGAMTGGVMLLVKGVGRQAASPGHRPSC